MIQITGIPYLVFASCIIISAFVGLLLRNKRFGKMLCELKTIKFKDHPKNKTYKLSKRIDLKLKMKAF
jgi:hypothetical protein